MNENENDNENDIDEGEGEMNINELDNKDEEMIFNKVNIRENVDSNKEMPFYKEQVDPDSNKNENQIEIVNNKKLKIEQEFKKNFNNKLNQNYQTNQINQNNDRKKFVEISNQTNNIIQTNNISNNTDNKHTKNNPSTIEVNYTKNYDSILNLVIEDIKKLKQENERISNLNLEYAYSASKLTFKLQELEKKFKQVIILLNLDKN